MTIQRRPRPQLRRQLAALLQEDQGGDLPLPGQGAGLGLPMACAALRSPFELDRLPEAVLRIPLYEYSPRAVRQVCRFLKGAGGCPA